MDYNLRALAAKHFMCNIIPMATKIKVEFRRRSINYEFAKQLLDESSNGWKLINLTLEKCYAACPLKLKEFFSEKEFVKDMIDGITDWVWNNILPIEMHTKFQEAFNQASPESVSYINKYIETKDQNFFTNAIEQFNLLVPQFAEKYDEYDDEIENEDDEYAKLFHGTDMTDEND